MADDGVQVTIGADVAPFVEGAERARNETDRLIQAIALLQKTVGAAARISTQELVTAINGLSGRMKALNADAQQSASGVQHYAASVTSAGHAAHGAGAGFGFFAREAHYMLDELSSGNMRRFEGTFMNVASTVLIANTALIPYAAGLAAAAAALGYMAYEAVAFKNATNELQMQEVIAQFGDLSSAAGSVVDAISKAADVSYSNAEKFAAPFVALGPGGEKIAEIASYYLPLYTQAGDDAAKAGEKLAGIFTDLTGRGAKFVVETVGLSEATKRSYEAYILAGDKAKAYDVILQALQIRLDASRQSLMETKEGVDSFAASMAAGISETEGFASAQDVLASVAQNVGEKLQGQRTAIAGLRSETAAETAQSKVAAAEKAAAADKIIEKTNAESTKVKELKGQLDQLGEAAGKIDTSTAEGYARAKENWDAQKKLQDELREAREKDAGGLIPDSAFSRAQEQIKQLEASYQGPRKALLEQEEMILRLQQRGNAVPSDTKEGQQFNDEIAAKRKAADAAGSEAYIKSEQIKTAAAGEGVAARVALAEKEHAEKLRLSGAGSPEEQSAQLQLAQAQRAAADEQRAIALQNAASEISAAQDTAAQRKKALDDLLSHKGLTDDLWLAKTKENLEQERSEVQRALEEQETLWRGHADKINAIEQERAKFNRKINDDIIAAERKAADDTAKVWKDNADKIASAFNSQISGLLHGTTSWATAMKNIAADMVENMIKNFIKMGVEWAANEVRMAAAHATGAAAQKSIDATAIQGDAGRAAAGAYAATAGVPIIGPVLAPAAAAVAYAGTLAFSSMDIGAWQVPEDQLAMVHRNELVATPAQGEAIRSIPDLLSGLSKSRAGDAAAGAPSGGDTHVHLHMPGAIDSGSVRDWFHDHAEHVASALNKAVRNGDHFGLKSLGAR